MRSRSYRRGKITRPERFARHMNRDCDAVHDAMLFSTPKQFALLAVDFNKIRERGPGESDAGLLCCAKNRIDIIKFVDAATFRPALRILVDKRETITGKLTVNKYHKHQI